MTDALVPLLAVAVVVVVVLPASALLAKGALSLLEREVGGGPLHGLDARFFVLVGSTALPLVWLLSAAVHQAEEGRAAVACSLAHGADGCSEPLTFAVALAALVLGAAALLLGRRRGPRGAVSREAEATRARVEALVARHAALTPLSGRIVLTEAPGFSISAHGLLAPRVFVGVAFAAKLGDDALRGALAHELEHVGSRDPLRYLLVELALSVNPLGAWLLRSHAARWQAAREAHCDREAVVRGAAPLALADAIVQAARPAPTEAVALGARDTAVLRLRVGMLLAFAERPPTRCCHASSPAAWGACALLVAALVTPHHSSSAPLDALHRDVERALTAR
ncbi:MAG: hypothetical protein IT374_03570 [Polyangiaceae bacterium]|nr:hypothetical protein [Polyangiaceae bacterium]